MEDHLEFENANLEDDYGQMKTLRLKGDQVGPSDRFDGVVGQRRSMDEDSDVRYGIDKEIYNFSSAPLNAKSALDGNRGLQERYEQF